MFGAQAGFFCAISIRHSIAWSGPTQSSSFQPQHAFFLAEGNDVTPAQASGPNSRLRFQD